MLLRLCGLRQAFELRVILPAQAPVVLTVKKRFGLFKKGRGTTGAGCKTQTPHASVIEPNLAVQRLPAALESSLGAAPALQFGECEFDVLAGTQVVGRIVQASTKIAA